MEKLTIEYMSIYLPYRLNIINSVGKITELTASDYPYFAKTGFTPILKSLSELKNDDDFWNEFYIEFGGGHKNIEHFKNSWGTEILLDPLAFGYKYWKLIIKRHYDVFGLIEKGLAKNILEIDAKTLKNVQV